MDFQGDELLEILNIFRAESEEIVNHLNDALLELEKNPSNKDLIVVLFRNAHSLKGAARMIGFTTIQNLAHKMEDIIGLAKDEGLVLTSQIADEMYKTVDLISKIIMQSIETGSEIFNKDEVENRIKILENLKEDVINNQDKISDNNTEQVDIKSLQKNIDEINGLIIQTLISIINLSENIDDSYIEDTLNKITNLDKIFDRINDFSIKNDLETIKLKLEIVLKCKTGLTPIEIENIQQRMDNIITALISLYENNNIEPIDYYGYAFEKKDYNNNSDKRLNIDTTNQPKEIEENDINENIEYLTVENPQIIPNIDRYDIQSKIKNLEISTDEYPGLIIYFSELKKSYQNANFTVILKKIVSLLDYASKLETLLDNSATEILINSANYCYDCINNIKPNGDIALICQQLTIAKQLLEISDSKQTPTSNYPTQNKIFFNQSNSLLTKFSAKSKFTNKNEKDFSEIFETGEIKTLHVESAKLDLMVNQMGELIATKIKTSKQLSELNNLNSSLEDWQKDYKKLIKSVKNFDKKTTSLELEKDKTSTLFIKQILNTLSEQSTKLNTILSGVNHIQRSNIENDIKMQSLIEEFDSMIKNIRVLPLATVFHLFGRMVRDIAKERGKQVELSITGSETSADKKIIEEIKNPLIHILRNSIDHGIETPEVRQELGKSSVGHIQINAKHLDNKILIEVIDDGQGFDIEKIKETAIKKGIYTDKALADMSDEEIINIVFSPGFTTGDEVTSISGRGIGMDVVKSKIAQLNGIVKVISEYGKGSCIQIELPVTMATMTAFLIQVSNQAFAIPMSVISTVICKNSDEILKNHDIQTVLLNGKNIPVYNLSDILELNETNNKQLKTIIVIETNNKSLGFIVDKLLGEQEILHKKLSPPLYKVNNLSGVTTLASGETCLILNTLDLIKNATSQKYKKLTSDSQIKIPQKKVVFSEKHLLVIDDSITTRTLEKNILTSVGFNVDVATNPIEAFNLLNEKHYDLILTDIEMPKMNGLEFLTQMKANKNYSNIPIIVMSSVHNANTKRKAYMLGAERYLIKGDFNQKVFTDIIAEILNKYQVILP